MNEYTYIIFDHNGRRLGKIEFGVRNSVPSAKEIKEAIKDGFPTGRLINYSFQQACVSTNKILGYGNIERCNFSGNTAGTPGCSLGGKRKAPHDRIYSASKIQ